MIEKQNTINKTETHPRDFQDSEIKSQYSWTQSEE